jgi:hypothetical protein
MALTLVAASYGSIHVTIDAPFVEDLLLRGVSSCGRDALGENSSPNVLILFSSSNPQGLNGTTLEVEMPFGNAASLSGGWTPT